MTTYVTRRGFITLVGSGAAVTAVAGCRPGTGGTDPTGAGADAGGPTSDVELRLMAWARPAEADRDEEDLAVFTSKTGIGVKLEFLDVGGYQDKLNTLFAAGDPPDVMFQVGRWVEEYATRGVLADLGEFSDVIDLDAVDPGLREQAIYEGKRYGVPTGSTTIAYVYDRDLVTGLELEMPDDTTRSWDDFAPAYEMEPAGTDEVQNILVTLATEVEYRRMTPQQAGEEFMSQSAAAFEAAG